MNWDILSIVAGHLQPRDADGFRTSWSREGAESAQALADRITEYVRETVMHAPEEKVEPPLSRVEAIRQATEIASEMGTEPYLDDVLALAKFLLEDS